MSARNILTLAFLALAILISPVAHAYTGSLTSPMANGIDGTGFWIDPGTTTLTWTVTPGAGFYNYKYKLELPRADVSHFILEVSNNFTANDITNLQVLQGSIGSYDLGLHEASNPGNPNMPGDIFGIKFDSTTGTTLEFSFDSPRAPVWGDFYAKCGAVGGTQNTAWNTGFLAADPTDGPSDGSLNFHILVPDTATAVVPEPASVVLGAMGLVGLVAKRRNRAK